MFTLTAPIVFFDAVSCENRLGKANEMPAQTTGNNRSVIPHFELTIGTFRLCVNTFSGIFLMSLLIIASLVFGLTFLLH